MDELERKFVARIERKRNPGAVSPRFASLNAGYQCSSRGATRAALIRTGPQALCRQARQSCMTGAARLPVQARTSMECRTWFAPGGTLPSPTGSGLCTERPSFREKSSRISASANVGWPDVVPYTRSLARRRWRIAEGNFQKINVPVQAGTIRRTGRSVSIALPFAAIRAKCPIRRAENLTSP